MSCQPNSRDSSSGRKKSFNVFMPQDSRRRAGITNFSKMLEIKGYELFRVDKGQVSATRYETIHSFGSLC
jgi:hypothetical protein